uniref:Peptidase_M13_N domain-containing protein n=1 Tax=Steinernema glaseri TaxID=37863 RepID=A0A1I7Y1W3_9BILA
MSPLVLISLFLPTLYAYLDYPDLGCKYLDGYCLPYNPDEKYYGNKFDMAYFFPRVLRSSIKALSLKTQYKIIALKPKIKRYFMTGEARTAEDALSLIQAHILPNETSTLRAGLLFETLELPKVVIKKIAKVTNVLLRSYYINNNRKSATTLMFIMMDLYTAKGFTAEQKQDLMYQFNTLDKLITEPITTEFIKNYHGIPIRRRVDKFIEVLRASCCVPNPRTT